MRYFLTKLMATLTRHSRYMPVIKWCEKSHIYNAFRVYEYLFGRRIGIRPEASTMVQYKNGRQIVTRHFFTTEALLVYVEGVVREFLKGVKFEFEWVTLPQLQYAHVGQTESLKLPSIVFAIAYDTIGTAGASAPSNSITHAHTVTGTDVGMIENVMIGDVNGGAGTISGITYAGTGTGWAQTRSLGPTGGRKIDMWDKAAPATGTNNVVVSFGNSVYADVNSLSYSGVDQTNIEDISVAPAAANPLTLTVTTVTDNAWLASCASILGTGAPTAGTGTTSRGSFGAMRVGDSNAAKTPVGSHSMEWTGGSVTGIMIAIKPASGTAIVPALASLGVGA